MLWVLGLPQAGIERDVVVGNLELSPLGFEVNLPADAVDDEPVADLLDPAVDSFKGEPLEVLPDLRVSFVPLPPLLLLFLVAQTPL